MIDEKLDLFNALRRYSDSMGDDEAVFCFTISEGSDGQIFHFGGDDDMLMTGLAGVQDPTIEVMAMQTLVCVMALNILQVNEKLRKSMIEDMEALFGFASKAKDKVA